MKQYFEILELQPGATPDEVKTAYRDLAKVWHPDRFKSDSPRLKSKAAEKLAEINEAYQKIRAYHARQKARKTGGADSTLPGSQSYTGYRPYTPGTSPDTGQSFSGYSRPTPNGQPQYRRPSSNGSTRSQSAAYRRNHHHTTSRARTSSNGSASQAGKRAHNPSHSPFAQAQTPVSSMAIRRHTPVPYTGYGNNYTHAYKKRRQRAKNSMAMYLGVSALLAITVAGIFFYLRKTDVSPPTLAEWKSEIEQIESSALPAKQENEDRALEALAFADEEALSPEEAGMPDADEPSAERLPARRPVPAGYFTIGSTKAEVLAAQGRPEQVMNGLLRYGFSSIFFEDDVVIGWHQSPDTPLKVLLTPRRRYNTAYFTRGSTRDEVLAIQGTPDHYRDRGRELRYGESRITFENGRVVSWHQHVDTPLKAKLLPTVLSQATHFTYNSTRDEVLSVQGTPTHFGENTFHYGYSTVQFKDDRVIGWNQSASSPLKIELQPSKPTSTKFFTKGSTRDEVIASQGTPDQYSERIFKYGHSSVSFENDRVVSWYESAASPLKARAE